MNAFHLGTVADVNAGRANGNALLAINAVTTVLKEFSVGLKTFARIVWERRRFAGGTECQTLLPARRRRSQGEVQQLRVSVCSVYSKRAGPFRAANGFNLFSMFLSWSARNSLLRQINP